MNKKKLKITLCLLLLAVIPVFAGELNETQKQAQRAIYDYLQKNHRDPVIDESDNSVCFYSNELFYWISFDKESKAPLLYSLHVKGFKVGSGKDQYRRSPAIVAANEVNLKHNAVRTTVDEKKVNFSIDVYAQKTENFTSVFEQNFQQLKGIHKEFKDAYSTALAAAQKAEQERADKAEQEARKNLPPSELRGMVEYVAFRSVDKDGKAVTEYDRPLRRSETHYIQVLVDIAPWQDRDKETVLELRITRPNGQPLTDKKTTSQLKISLVKSRKTQSFEFGDVNNLIGSDKPDFWQAGEYKVDILEGGDVIKSTSFNLL